MNLSQVYKYLRRGAAATGPPTWAPWCPGTPGVRCPLTTDATPPRWCAARLGHHAGSRGRCGSGIFVPGPTPLPAPPPPSPSGSIPKEALMSSLMAVADNGYVCLKKETEKRVGGIESFLQNSWVFFNQLSEREVWINRLPGLLNYAPYLRSPSLMRHQPGDW